MPTSDSLRRSSASLSSPLLIGGISAAAFVGLAINVILNNDLTHIDAVLANWSHANRVGWLLSGMPLLSALHGAGIVMLYLGVHYLSDVVAAAFEGIAWLALTMLWMRARDRRRAARPEPTRRGTGAKRR